MKCFNPDCLYENPSNHNFCQECGQKLLLTQRYRGLKYLGEGGFGRTFIGVDQNRRNSSCVIKQFLPLSQGSGALQKCIQLFEQEAELLEKLGKHPQIPDLLAFFEQDNKLYLIQEYIEGQDLFKELQNQGIFSESKVKSFLLEMLPVLDFIHNKSIIHRDIKPENIIRRKDKLDSAIYGKISDLVLIDFGVSKQASATIMTRMGTITGTPGYAPPEQLRGLTNNSSDLYSLAVTAIRLLTNVFPEERNNSFVDDIFDVYNLTWVWKEWLSKNGLSISKDFANILDKMLADKVKDRFQTAGEVLNALQNNNAQQVSHLSSQGNIGKKPVPPPSNLSPTIVQPIKQVSNLSSQGNIGKKPVPPPPPIIKLQTSKPDFTKLEELLRSGKWQEADIETGKVMCKIMGRENEGWLTEENCKNFPRKKLRIIDDLWVKYSNGKFGFSVQKQILLNCRGKVIVYDRKVAKKFGDAVGWRKEGEWLNYSELSFTNNWVKSGHLPADVWFAFADFLDHDERGRKKMKNWKCGEDWEFFGGWWIGVLSLFSKL